MIEVTIRQMRDGEHCAMEGCIVGPPQDLVMLEVNGRQMLEICGICVAVTGQALMAEARHVELRRQGKLGPGPAKCLHGPLPGERR